MPQAQGQKNIGRNRPPRVQIEYDLEDYGSPKKIALPFVMGVMADLAGKSAATLPSVADRKFLEIDVDTFNDRLKALKPSVAFAVPNALTGKSDLGVKMTFQSMDDFAPGAIARNVEPLRHLLDAREQLAHLLSYMDGKDSAEQLIARLLSDKTLQETLAGTAKPVDSAT